MIRKLVLLPLLAASFAIAPPAFADDADKAACENKADGDGCTRGDGDAGTCQPDESDPNVLTCDDDPDGSGGSGAGGSSNGGCSSSGSSDTGAFGVALALAAVGLAVGPLRRRARREAR